MENYPLSGVLGHHSHQNLNRGDGDFDMVNGDGLITREETRFGIVFTGNINPMASVGIVKYDLTVSKNQ